MANIGPSGQFIPVIATGGHVVAHASDIRIFMKKLKGNSRRAKIDDCAWLPNETADFFITNQGISDTETIEESSESTSKSKTKAKSKSKSILTPTVIYAKAWAVTVSATAYK